MRDRANKPVDEAIFWVEYVVRHKGAKHLRVSYLDMPLYQIYMLDIIGLLFGASIVIILSTVFTLMKLYTFITKYFANKKDCEHVGKKNN